ncbi:type II toxin-antitoxin system Phd/YefM family antitoxin [Candidatus Kaiserbacteria bacterium]|nr:type II toxin-antitoxin system Phd/YefM family antitoxin [Candidatus Kaiserbacteria bacterium]
MTTTIAMTKARTHLGAIVQRLRTKGERVILEKDGVPVAAIVEADFLEDVLDSLEIMKAREETRKDPLVDWAKIRARYV